MRAAIRDIAYHLPERVVTNEELRAENPAWDMDRVAERTGVLSRHIARDDETALDLGYEACLKLFAADRQALNRVDGIIFCTQSPDYIMPPNSCLLQERLGLGENIFALDFTLACSGFVYGLALAQGLVMSGAASSIILVTADTYSKYIHKQDRSARVLFGDGAAATWITASDSSRGVIDVMCATSGKGHESFMVPAGGCRIPRSPETAVLETDRSGNVRSQDTIHMDGFGILTFIGSKVPDQVRAVLDRNDMTVDSPDMYVFHQASKLALDALERTLKLPSEKVYRNLGRIGNMVSASVPIALSDALSDGSLARGDTALVSGFGVGLSWGTALIEM